MIHVNSTWKLRNLIKNSGASLLNYYFWKQWNTTDKKTAMNITLQHTAPTNTKTRGPWATSLTWVIIIYIWFRGKDFNSIWDIWALPVLRGTGQLHMVMNYIPSDVIWHKKQQYMWCSGGDLKWFLYGRLKTGCICYGVRSSAHGHFSFPDFFFGHLWSNCIETWFIAL
jgi:hypothetical protein